MHTGKLINRLKLKYQTFFNDHIGPETHTKIVASINHGNLDLPAKTDVSVQQLKR